MDNKFSLCFLIGQISGGGAEWQCLLTANELAKLGANVTIYTMSERWDYLSRFKSLAPTLTVKALCSLEHKTRKSKLVEFCKFALRLRKQIKKTPAKVIVFAWLELLQSLSFFSVFGLKQASLYWCMRNEGKLCEDGSDKLMHKLRILNKYFAWRVTGLVGNSVAGIDNYNKKLKYNIKRTLHFPNIVSQEHFYPYCIDKKRQLREKYDVKDNDFIILSFSRINPVKNIESIIKSIPLLQKKISQPVKLFIVGEGKSEYITSLKNLVRKEHLEAYVFWFGQQQCTADFYNMADLYILASFSEGMSNTLAEALACGCYALATKVGEAEHMLPSNQLLIKPSPEEIVAKYNPAIQKDNFLVHGLGGSVNKLYKFLLENKVAE